MRTAGEYINGMLKVNGVYTDEVIEHAINEARKEAIEECAERAEAIEGWNTGFSGSAASVDKQSILSLIDELK